MDKKKIDYIDWLKLKSRVLRVKALINKFGINPEIREKAAIILTQRKKYDNILGWAVREKDYLGELNAIFNWVKRNIRYQYDPIKKDIIEDPFTTLKLRIADCDGMTVLLGSLVQSVGYPVMLKVIKQYSNRVYDIYPLVGIPPLNPKNWIAMNAVFKNRPIGYQPKYTQSIIIPI